MSAPTNTESTEGVRRAAGRGWMRPALIIGAVVIAVVLSCAVGGIVYLNIAPASGNAELGSRESRMALGLPAPPEPAADQAVVEVVEEVEAERVLAYSGSSGADVAYAAERLIIRTGNISLVVEDTRATQETIDAMVQGMAGQGAFVVSSDEYGGDEDSQPHITMSIRIPAARFDETMDRLADLAVHVNSRNESAQDVTEEYVDLEARLESLEAARQRLLEIMQEARVTKDLLDAEQQLTQREAEIESIKGRMQYLEESARLSSIWIELQPYILSQPVSDQWRPAETVRRAVEALVDGLKGFADFLIVFAIAVLPWLLALALVIYLIVRLVRWRAGVRRERRAAGPQASE